MSDNDLGLYARRPERPAEPVVEFNAPIDTTQADCMTTRELIRGWIAAAKDEARRWEPRVYPGDVVETEAR